VFKCHRTLKKVSLKISENTIIIHYQKSRLKARYVIIYTYKIQKITCIIVCSEVSENRTCMLQICVVIEVPADI